MSWLAYEHYAYAALAVLGTLLAVWLVGRLMQHHEAHLRPFAGVVPPFINIIGVLFGLTLAFIGNDTWSARDRAMDAVFQEADGLRVLLALADEGLDAEVRAYGRAVAGEWPSLRARQTDPEVTRAADTLLRAVADPDVAARFGDNVQQMMLEKVVEIRAERDLRISLTQTHLNPLKWMGMAFLGLVTILSVAAVHIGQPRAAMLAIWLFALAAAPSAAIVLVQGNPFQIPAAVGPEPILAALR